MSKIKVVLWDIDGTLLNFHKAEAIAIGRCFEKFHLGICTDKMLQRYSEINRSYWERLERGEITKTQVLEGRFQEFFAKEGLELSIISEFNKEYQVQLGEAVVFEEGAMETVQSLKSRVIQCAVTNGTKIAQKRKLAKSGLEEVFEEIFISEEIGVEKPGKGFFEYVFSKIGNYNKEEVLIVGDSLTSDMRGGNNAGILSCWYNPKGTENKADVVLDYEITELKQVLDIVIK